MPSSRTAPKALPATELYQLTASQTASAIRLGQTSATEVAQSHLQRIEAVNPALNAIVEHRPEEILARARHIDQLLAQGHAVGPLAGVPVTIKVIVDQKGYATTCLLYTSPSPRD